jgi:hypothetical protein
MARGWESKSVEDQMASLEARPAAPHTNYPNAEAKRVAQNERAHRERKMQALLMQKENILSQRTSNPARRKALEAALSQIEGQIAELG